MLYKAIGIILSALFIAAFQINAASAGCGGGHGGFRTFQSKAYNKQALQQSRARKARAVAAAKQKKAVQQARVEKNETPKVAEAAPAPVKAETTAADKEPESERNVVASVEQTCTKFFAETGTTVTVECAKE
jgi:biotin carboxyl carrier protein